jgi:hypothetical protein
MSTIKYKTFDLSLPISLSHTYIYTHLFSRCNAIEELSSKDWAAYQKYLEKKDIIQVFAHWLQDALKERRKACNVKAVDWTIERSTWWKILSRIETDAILTSLIFRINVKQTWFVKRVNKVCQSNRERESTINTEIISRTRDLTKSRFLEITISVLILVSSTKHKQNIRLTRVIISNLNLL